MARLSISLLWPFQVTLDGKPVTAFESNKVRALLAYLAVEADRPHRRDTLAALLWPDWPDRSARTNLRNALANLRKAIRDSDIDPPHLLATRETIQFNADSDHWLDVAAFRALVEAEHGIAQAALRGREVDGLAAGYEGVGHGRPAVIGQRRIDAGIDAVETAGGKSAKPVLELQVSAYGAG